MSGKRIRRTATTTIAARNGREPRKILRDPVLGFLEEPVSGQTLPLGRLPVGIQHRLCPAGAFYSAEVIKVASATAVLGCNSESPRRGTPWRITHSSDRIVADRCDSIRSASTMIHPVAQIVTRARAVSNRYLLIIFPSHRNIRAINPARHNTRPVPLRQIATRQIRVGLRRRREVASAIFGV